MGSTAQTASAQTSTAPARFLAGLFLYTVLTNENTSGQESLKQIHDEYINLTSSNRMIALLDSPGSVSTYVPAPIESYLLKIQSTFNQIKTLLYNDTPHPFYDFYVCNDIYRFVRDPQNKRRSLRISIENATPEKLAAESNFVLLSGTGGLGKSMMMRHLLLDAASRYPSNGCKLPVFIQLKNYKENFSDLTDFVLHEVRSFWPQMERSQLEQLLLDGHLLLLFDGLDEIRMELANNFQQDLDFFINNYSDNQYIISPRPNMSTYSYSRFTVLHLQTFTKEQALELIDRLDFRPDMPDIKEKFRKQLNDRLYWTHHGFSDNPLLLTIMLMTFEEYAEVPSKMHIFYQEAYTVLAKKHDATKGGFRRELETKVTTDEFADIFSRFCGITYNDEKLEFTWTEMDCYYRDLYNKFSLTGRSTDDFIFDVCSNLCIMYLEGGRYNFIHRSFQEYFCARYFARQKDKNLERIGKLFDHNRLARQSDQTFQMLYDMIPEKVTEFIIIPYLCNLLNECSQEDGYHTFLCTAYGTVEM